MGTNEGRPRQLAEQERRAKTVLQEEILHPRLSEVDVSWMT